MVSQRAGERWEVAMVCGYLYIVWETTGLNGVIKSSWSGKEEI
jgi:hypothetical protein